MSDAKPVSNQLNFNFQEGIIQNEKSVTHFSF
jgi:hypothetical protein